MNDLTHAELMALFITSTDAEVLAAARAELRARAVCWTWADDIRLWAFMKNEETS